MKKRIFIITILIAISVKAQVNIDPHRNYSTSMINASRIERSPNVAAFMKYGNYPVNNFTGLTQIKVPIYTIKEKNFEMPIELSYHGGGRKVDEIASWVGLGWNLDVGGMIHREVRQYPDDYFVDFWPPYGDNQNNMHHINQYTTVTAKGYLRNVEENGPGLFNIATGLQQGYLHNNWEENDPRDVQEWSREDAFEAYFGEFHGSYGDYRDWQTGELVDMQIAHSLAYNRHLGQGYDLQPDVFQYNFNGYSGTFLFDYESNIIQVPVTDLRIEKTSDIKNYEGKMEGFKITTPDGTIYFFEAAENTQTYTSSGYDRCDGGYVNHDYDYRYTMNYKSSWLLTKISTPLGQTINFEYEDYFIHTQVPIHKMRWEDPNLGCGQLNGDGVSFTEMYENRITISTKLLKKIDTPNSIIYFVHSTGYREDQPTSKFLSEVNIYSKQTSSFIKSFSFDYDYFLTNTNSTEASEKRLKLNNIVEHNNGESMAPYTFFYNTQRLPKLYSVEQDMFGYYNANGATHMIPQVYIYPNLTNQNRYRLNKISGYPEISDGTGQYGAQYFIGGANRTLNETALQACMLNKIEYPTGGVTEFYYEPNDYYDEVINENIYGGGLRIRKQTSKGFSSSPDLTLQYSYTQENDVTKSSGMISNLPVFAHYIPWVRIGIDIKNSNNINSASEKYKTLILRYNLNQNALEAAQGSTVGYKRTVVDQGINGTEEFYYSFPLSANQDVDNTSFAGTTFERSKTYNGDSYTPPFAPNPDYSYWRGLLLEKKVKNNNGKFVHHEIFEYSKIRSKPYPHRHSIEEWFNTMPAIVYNPPLIDVISQSVGIGYFDANFAIYNPYITNCVRLTDKYVRSYDMQDTSNQNYIESHEQYEYIEDNISYEDHLYPVVKRIWNSAGETLKTEYKYPTELTGIEQSPYMSQLVTANRISDPVITETFNGTTKLSEVHVKYGNSSATGNILLPTEVHTRKGVGDINIANADNRKLRYTQYDTNGNVLEYQVENGTYTSFIWGYNKQYPIAKVEGATYSQVSSYVSALQTASNNGSLTQASFSSLRSGLSGAMVTTYTYNPLIGMTSSSDYRGYTTTYVYDSFGRLKEVKDADGNIVSANGYNYKQ